MLDDSRISPDDEDEEDMAELEEYERERQANIKENASLLASLGLENAIPVRRAVIDKKPQLSSEERRVQREARARAAALKRNVEPTRRSGRVAANSQRANIVRDDDSASPSPGSSPYRPKPAFPKQKAPIVPSGPDYKATGPLPRQAIPSRDKHGVMIFEAPWKGIFKPNLTPEEMFRGGAFGGAFFCDTFSKVLKCPLPSAPEIATLPFTLPDDLVDTKLAAPEPDPSTNRFRVRAGQSLQEWEKAGWIWEEDPRGWAQWYTRFWGGRRSADDRRQITRWLKVAGPTGRFKSALVKQVVRAGGKRALDEEDVGRIVRQTLWQWGYQLTESEWDTVMSA